MKSQHLIVMSIVRPTSCIHANRDDWEFAHITTPRPSCIDAWKRKDALRRMVKGETITVNGLQVYKNGKTFHKRRYVVGGQELTFEDAIAYIENPPTVAQDAGVPVQLALEFREAS